MLCLVSTQDSPRKDSLSLACDVEQKPLRPLLTEEAAVKQLLANASQSIATVRANSKEKPIKTTHIAYFKAD